MQAKIKTNNSSRLIPIICYKNNLVDGGLLEARARSFVWGSLTYVSFPFPPLRHDENNCGFTRGHMLCLFTSTYSTNI